jgi:hypothetical protein
LLRSRASRCVVDSIRVPPGFYNVTTSVAFHTGAVDALSRHE